MIKAYDDSVYAFWCMIYGCGIIFSPIVVGVIVWIVDRLTKVIKHD